MIVVILMSFFIPSKNVLSYNYFCFSLFLLMTSFFFYFKKKVNFFDFDSIFIFIYGIVAFLFPVFLSTISITSKLFNSLNFNSDLISKGVYIALLGITGYYFGSLFLEQKTHINEEKNIIDTKYLVLFTLICAFLFWLLGGVQYFQSVYLKNGTKQSGGFILQIIALLQSFLLVTIATEAYNISVSKSYKVSKFFISTCLLISFLFLYAGSRTNASFFLLPIIYWYLKSYKPIGFFKFILFMFFAILLMWTVQLTRTGSDVELKQGISVFKDLILVNRNTYVGIEYVDKYGFTYGKTMLSGIIGVVPSLERILTNLFGLDIRSFGSAELFTDYTFGSSRNSFGLGTNIFIDIFISFGYLGTFLLLMLLGFFVKLSFNKVNSFNYYYYVIYTILIANSVYVVRAGYTYPFKLLIWTLVIANLNLAFSRKIKIHI